MITIEQCRAARGLIGWTQQELADACGLSKTAINNFEKGNSDMKAESLKAVRRAFEAVGIVFDGRIGLHKREDFAEILKGSQSVEQLLDDIVITLDQTDDEVLILFGDTIKPDTNIENFVQSLQQKHIPHRILGAPEQIANDPILPQAAIRSFIFGSKLALQLWDGNTILLVESKEASNAERARFEILWENRKNSGQNSHTG